MNRSAQIENMTSTILPFSLRDEPSLIERVWPAQQISVETQKERKAVQGQTITTLGTYWKGRKPLFLVRACILASLMPATDDIESDLKVLDLLLGMDDSQIAARLRQKLLPEDVLKYASNAQKEALLDNVAEGVTEIKRQDKALMNSLSSSVIARMPYSKRVEKLARPEEVSDLDLIHPHLQEINRHLGTSAKTSREVVHQLGIMRFGHPPRAGDTFAGGGSIPFEAARSGCSVYASDLNPIACMLTWGAINIVGSTKATRDRVRAAQKQVVRFVESQVKELGIERDSAGNQTKAHLYCLEVICPKTGWRVPLLPNFIVSPTRRTVAVLEPDSLRKRFHIKIVSNATAQQMSDASVGTIRNGNLTYQLAGEEIVVSMKAIRGDRRNQRGETVNDLRRWQKSDSAPNAEDIFQERLYCVQWIKKESVGKARQETFFAEVTAEDELREKVVSDYVNQHLSEWQLQGLVPDMPIEAGEKTDEPIRTRGWTYWHHFFNQRQIFIFAQAHLEIRRLPDFERSALLICFAKALDWGNKGCRFGTGAARESISNLFSNQALNTLYNYGCRSSDGLMSHIDLEFNEVTEDPLQAEIRCVAADKVGMVSDIFITDPPYADAVNYHEITEFFIAWLRRDAPKLFSDWVWDSRRPLAIKGDGEQFRLQMVAAYRAMADQMPENGIQIVMFTHQSASVWADMAQIFWGAGLQVMAAWYIATETTSDLKKGGYVQGTVILVLRKRKADEAGYKDEIVQEVKSEVAEQINTMVGLNQSLKGSGRIENLFEDADLQMAGYAAALRVLTRYQRIDGTDMAREALRQRRPGEKDLVGEIIEFAVQVANEHMVPESMPPKVWEQLSGPERFYFKMMDIETTALRKLDNYQNFSKAFRVSDYGALMGSMEPNKASLKTAKEFRKAGFEIPDFGASTTRAALYAIMELENDVEADGVLAHLRDLLPSYHSKRDELLAISDYIAKKRVGVVAAEARAARILYDLIRNERFG